MALNVQKAKLDLIQWLTTLEDTAIIQKLLEISQQNDSSHKLTKAEKVSVLKGLDDLKKGNVVAHSDAKKVYEKWL